MNKTKKITILSALILVALQAQSQTVYKQDTSLVQPSSGDVPSLAQPMYSDAYLKSVKCDPGVWNKLMNDYMQKRGGERLAEDMHLVQKQKNNTPPAKKNGGKTCTEQAIDQVNGAITKIENLGTVLTGISAIAGNRVPSIPWGKVATAAGAAAGALLDKQVCSEVNSINQGISGQVNQVVSQTNQQVYQGINSTGQGNQIYGAIGKQTGGVTSLPTVQAPTVKQTLNKDSVNSLQNTLQTVNPFK
jgi:hypothetical protein